ncbi:type IV toxin-antitoxin system AbiEi family antitoxin [Leucobacter albus]|uniref:Type IV toxin-antitoxin system AbiEi family antitoxin n=1 Tax=Leucobacter albus TaxID=272210 RepID=A0ABW3TLJ9_9MICO
MDPLLAEALSARLRDYGLDVGSDPDLSRIEPYATVPFALKYRGQEERFQVTYAPQMTLSSLEQPIHTKRGEGKQLIVGPRITDRSAEILRSNGANYIDGGGNAYISFGDVLIDVRGRKPLTRLERNALVHSRGGVNLMSPKRAQVIFAILSWEHLLDGPVRALAVVSQVSVGQAQQTLDLLTEHGFLERNRTIHQFSRDRLLEQWVQAYPSGLGATQLRMQLVGETSLPLESDSPLVLSGESAIGDALRPETLTIYSAQLPNDLIRARRWRRAEGQPNIFLKMKFWEDPNQQGSGGDAAPPLLVYADLLAAQDGRQREAAGEFRRQRDQLRAG